MIEAHRIEYRGYSSVDFDLITCLSFESDNGEVNSFLTREAVASESYRGEFRRIHQMKYTETFTPKFTFIKQGFGDFNTEEIRKVLRWLTGGANASFLTVYKDDSNVVYFEILGAFSNISLYKLGNGRCVGFVAEFESSAPWAFSPLQTITKTITGTTNNTFNIEVDSDDEENAIYPRITIQKNGNGDVTITNTYADQNRQSHLATLQLKNNGDKEIITVDGANKVISSSNARIVGDDFVGWSWLPMYNGTNTIAVTGNCTIKFEFRTVVKCGEY